MTDPTIPDVTPEPEPEPATPTKTTRWPWIAGIVAALFIGIGIGIGAAAGGGGDDGAQTTTPDDVVEDAETAAPAYTPPPEPAEPTYPDPVVADYTITLYETEKQCFGSAGCNVTFTVDLAYAGPVLDPAKTYELRYEVDGAEDPLLSTLEITGDEYTSTESSVSTASESDELTVTALDIRER